MMRHAMIILGMLFFAACQGDEQSTQKDEPVQEVRQTLKGQEWLLGDWVAVLDRATMSESWWKESDTVFRGEAVMVANGDTVSSEGLRLFLKDDKRVYEATVSNQNESKAIPFFEKDIQEHQMIFRNDTHDFPQMVRYVQFGKDSMIAEISGAVQGETKAFQFPMKKMKGTP